jgi:hypothetical protein
MPVSFARDIFAAQPPLTSSIDIDVSFIRSHIGHEHR